MPRELLKVFLSYRRDDAGYAASWLDSELTEAFGRDNVFKDIDSISLGEDFVQRITSAIRSSDVLLVLIGSRWMTIGDGQGGRRLDAADDLVRLEIETALRCGCIVVPVLLDGAQMPRRTELPSSIEALSQRQAAALSHSRFVSDVRWLIAKLQTLTSPLLPPTSAGGDRRAASPDPLLYSGPGADDEAARLVRASADAARTAMEASSVLRGKEETGNFDVFLCHNVSDKPAVRELGARLRERGLLPWLDEEQLRPGRPWQQELERRIDSIGAAAVLIGPSGVGPWQSQEIMAFLRGFVERGSPVIPVLLPGSVQPDLPLLLRGMTWVDVGADDALDRLVWGITGERPWLLS